MKVRYYELAAGRPAGNRIIGVEFRLVVPTGVVEEVALFPLDVELEPQAGYYGPQTGANVTVHTSAGDATSPVFYLPN